MFNFKALLTSSEVQDEGSITIMLTTKDLEKLVEMEDEANWMQCYRDAGVDNWHGRDYAIDLHDEMFPEED